MKKIFFFFLAMISFVSFSQTLMLEKEVELKISQKNLNPETHLFKIRDKKNNKIVHLMVAREEIKGNQSIVFNRIDDNLKIEKFSILAEGSIISSTQDFEKIHLILKTSSYTSTTINCISFDLETNEIKEVKTKLKFGEYFYGMGQIEDNLFFLCVSYLKPTVYYCNTKTGEVKKHEELSSQISVNDFNYCYYQIYWNKNKDHATLLKVNKITIRKLSSNWSIYKINCKTLEIVKELKVKLPDTDDISISNIYSDEDDFLLTGWNKEHLSIIKIDENGNGTEEIIKYDDIPGYKGIINDCSSKLNQVCSYVSREENNYNIGVEVYSCAIENKYDVFYYSQTILLHLSENGKLIWCKSYSRSDGKKESFEIESSILTMKINDEINHQFSRIDWNKESINLCTLIGEDVSTWKLKNDGTILEEKSSKIPLFSNTKFKAMEIPFAVSNTSMFSINNIKIKGEYFFLVRKYSIK